MASGETCAIYRVADRLDSVSPYSATVDYTVSLPMTDDDVVYRLRLATERNTPDPLLGENYLIDWTYLTRDGELSGFTAYFDGHFYRYRDRRLIENHYQWDTIPFRSNGGDVQRTSQFVNLLPFSIAAQLRDIAGDSTYTCTIEQKSNDLLVIKAIRHISGIESQNIEMTFNAADCLPIKSLSLYNPGQPGEQEIMVTYSYDPTPQLRAIAAEEDLIARYPEVFEKYRVSNYTVESLRGDRLPGFSLPTPQRSRFTYNRGDRFAVPTIIAALDASVASTPETIATLRQTASLLPMQTQLILIFDTNDAELAEEITGSLQPGETVLLSGKSFYRDCGINAYPTVLLCTPSGTVAEIFLGQSSSLSNKLLQSAALIRQ